MKQLYLVLSLWSFFAISMSEIPSHEKLIVIVTTSYNNSQWLDRNLSSVFSQNYQNYHLIYVDDCSTDGTADQVQAWIEKKEVVDRVTLIRNEERVGAMANQFHAIHLIPDGAIVCILDGDDWMAGPNALTHINTIFSNPNIWFSYGQFRCWPNGDVGWCVDIPKRYVDANGFRDFQHNLSHMRVFYAGLFKQIKEEDFKLEGKFLRMCADNAATFPMAEMARGHIFFNREVIYIWNGANNISDHKVVRGLQQALDRLIRKRPRYEKVETPFLDGQDVSVAQIKKNVECAIQKRESK